MNEYEEAFSYFENLSGVDPSQTKPLFDENGKINWDEKTRDLFDRNGMTVDRYDQLMNNPELVLTEGELRVGWYWSPSWDGMLVHKTWPEAKFDFPEEDINNPNG